jgi:photosystem II stability/assembly factor-like uncharacterized protein
MQGQHHLYESTDAGEHWTRRPNPLQLGAPAALADNGAGHIFLATESGGADLLLGAVGNGLEWRVAVRDGGVFFGWADLSFVTPNFGYVVGPTHYAPQHLYVTRDGGASWHVTPISS